MARKKLLRIINSEDRGASMARGPSGVLSLLFSRIMRQLDVHPETWGFLMRKYVEDPSNGVAGNKKEQTSARGNLSAAFSHHQMTWKVFCKALKFFQVGEATIVLELRMKNGTTQVITADMKLSGVERDPLTKADLADCLDHVVAEEIGDEEATKFFDIQYIPDSGQEEDR